MSPADGERDARDTVAVAASLCAVVLASVYWVSRIGFDNPVMPVASAAGLSLFHTASPLLARDWVAARHAERWWMSQPCLILYALVLSLLAGVVAQSAGVRVAPALSLAGFASAAVILIRWVSRGRPWPTLLFTGGSTVFALWAAGVVWATRYKLPLYWEQFSLNANVHHDPIYYASMANMLRAYGVPSTGIDGVPYIHYHYGSAWMFSQWADLIGTDVMTFYNLGYPIVVIPLFLTAFLLLGIEYAARVRPDAFTRPMRRDYLLWIVVLVAMIGVLPEPILFALAIWHAHLLISESYLAGLPVFLLATATAVVYWWTGGRERRGGAGRQSAAFLLLFVPLALAVSGFLKVSLMILLLLAGLYLAFRLGLFRDPVVRGSAILSVAVCALVYRAVVLPDQNEGIVPLAFIRSQVPRGGWPFFPLLHLAWTWIYIACRLWQEKIRTVGDLAASVRERRILDVEVLAVVAVCGFLPGELIDIHGGSAFYFSDVQRWLALALIVGRIGLWMEQRVSASAIRDSLGEEGRPRGLRGMRASTVLAALVLIPFAATLLLNTLRPPVRLLRANIAVRRAIASMSNTSQGSVAGVGALVDRSTLADGLRRTTYYPLVTALRRINTMSDSERRQTALFIPQSHALYWRMFDDDDRCAFVPLVAPAFAGVAMLDGMPPTSCAPTEQYNMRKYRPRATDQTPADATPAALCARAKAEGFSRVIVLAPEANTGARTMSCR